MKKKLVRSKLVRPLIILAFFIFLVLIDQASKFYVFSTNINRCVLVCIRAVSNYGIAFGLFNMSPLVIIITTVVGLIIIGVSLFYMIQNESLLLKVALLFIVSGTTSNLIDRIILRYVRDFITFSFWNFPSFNLADVFNVTGALLLVIVLLKTDQHQHSKNKQKSKHLNR